MKRIVLVILVLAPFFTYAQKSAEKNTGKSNKQGTSLKLDDVTVMKMLNQKMEMLKEDLTLLVGKKAKNLDKVIQNAFELWNKDNSKFVTVTSAEDKKLNTKEHVLDYLKAMSKLPYKKADIQYGDFTLVNNITKGPDGKYHGFVEFTQEFTATIEKGESKLGTLTDFSKRSVEIIIEVTDYVNKNGQQDQKVELFFGNMAIQVLK